MSEKYWNYIDTAPERLALVTDTSVPLLQVTQRQARVLFDEGVATLALIGQAPEIIFINCDRLFGTRRFARAGWCRGRGARSDTARGRSRRGRWLVNSLNAVWLSSLKVIALSSDGRVLQPKRFIFLES